MTGTTPSSPSGARALPVAARVFLRLEQMSSLAGTVLASAALSAAALIGLYQIIGRFILEEPAPWSEPVVRTLLIWMVYLGICGAARTGSLVAVDVLYVAAPPKIQQPMRLLVLVLSVVFFVVLGWCGLQMVEFVQHQILAGVGVSIAWSYAAIPTGSVLAILALIAHWLQPPAAFEDDRGALSEQAL